MKNLTEEFVTPKELALHWRLSIRTVRLYIAEGALRALRRRGRIFIAWTEVWRHEARSRPCAQPAALRKRPLLTINEAAAIARHRPSYLYALAARGDAPTCRVFGNVRFLEADLRAWMRASVTPRAQTPHDQETSHATSGQD